MLLYTLLGCEKYEKSRIFKQMQNGVFVRMAVISMAMEGML